jgi:hypothetical protein
MCDGRPLQNRQEFRTDNREEVRTDPHQYVR